MRIMYTATELESVGDVIDNSLLGLAGKKHRLKVDFTKEGWTDITEMHLRTLELSELSMGCFLRQDEELARKVVELKRKIREVEKEFRERHMQRLAQGKIKAVNTSSIHLDVLSEYRRICTLMSHHAYGFLESEKNS